MRIRSTSLTVVLAATGLLAAGSPARLSANTVRSASAGCHVISAAKIPFGQLETSYRKLTGLGSKTPLARTQPQHYGACGATHYAFVLLVVAKGVKLTYRQQVAQQDHSPVWVERSGGQWVDEGLDTPCRLAPAALINLWKIGVRCK